MKLDIANEEDVKNLYKTVQKEFGRSADVLLNNAGYLDDGKLVGEGDVADWWKGLVSFSFIVFEGGDKMGLKRNVELIFDKSRK